MPPPIGYGEYTPSGYPEWKLIEEYGSLENLPEDVKKAVGLTEEPKEDYSAFFTEAPEMLSEEDWQKYKSGYTDYINQMYQYSMENLGRQRTGIQEEKKYQGTMFQFGREQLGRSKTGVEKEMGLTTRGYELGLKNIGRQRTGLRETYGESLYDITRQSEMIGAGFATSGAGERAKQRGLKSLYGGYGRSMEELMGQKKELGLGYERTMTGYGQQLEELGARGKELETTYGKTLRDLNRQLAGLTTQQNIFGTQKERDIFGVEQDVLARQRQEQQMYEQWRQSQIGTALDILAIEPTFDYQSFLNNLFGEITTTTGTTTGTTTDTTTPEEPESNIIDITQKKWLF